MNILTDIVNNKLKEVEERKALFPTKLLERSIYFSTQPVSLKKYLSRADKCGIIAEIKKKSPSKGVLNNHISIEELSIGYMQAGASALSVLTDSKFFGGKNEDLTIARKFNFCPILRKDFTVDEYQIIEAKSIGADAILLIAAILEKDQIEEFANLAHSFGLEVILEVHNQDELRNKLTEKVDIVGVNNRNLKTLSVDLETSLNLSPLIPNSFTKISESGISSPESIRRLKKEGYTGFLIGEAFMVTSQPARACARLIDGIKEARQ